MVTARTRHHISNTQAQPVQLLRVVPAPVLLPRRLTEVIEQGSNSRSVAPTLGFATLGTATATGGLHTIAAAPTIATAIVGTATATGSTHLGSDGTAVHQLGTVTVGTATATGMAATGTALSGPFLSQETDTATQAFGRNATPRYGQSFEVAGPQTLNMVSVKLEKAGGPADGVTVSIYSNGTDRPSSTVLETAATVSGAAISTTAAWIDFTLDAPLSLSASTQYWIVVERTGALNDSNYYRWRRSSSNITAAWLTSLYTTGWSAGASSYDFCFRLS